MTIGKIKNNFSKMKKESFIAWNSRMLSLASRGNMLSILFSAMLDAVFIAISFFAFSAWYSRIIAKMASISLPGPSQLASMSQAAAQSALAEARSFYIALVLSLILLIIALIFVFSVCSALIWARISKKTLSIHLLSRFAVLDIVWIFLLPIIIFFISMYAEPSFVIIFISFIILFYFYSTLIIHSSFIRTEKLRSIFAAFQLGFGKIRLYALPFASLLAVFYLLSFMNSKLSFDYSWIIYAALFLLSLAFIRHIFFEITKSIELGK